jgi:hypothetical protein
VSILYGMERDYFFNRPLIRSIILFRSPPSPHPCLPIAERTWTGGSILVYMAPYRLQSTFILIYVAKKVIWVKDLKYCTLAMGREFVKLKINIANADFKDRLFIGSVSFLWRAIYIKMYLSIFQFGDFYNIFDIWDNYLISNIKH